MSTSQENSVTHENSEPVDPAAPSTGDTPTNTGTAGVNPTNEGSRPGGGTVSTGTMTGGDKPDPVATGPTVHDTIAGRNDSES